MSNKSFLIYTVSLSYAARADALERYVTVAKELGYKIAITDVVLGEISFGSAGPRKADITEWLRANPDTIEIVKTDIGQSHATGLSQYAKNDGEKSIVEAAKKLAQEGFDFVIVSDDNFFNRSFANAEIKNMGAEVSNKALRTFDFFAFVTCH